jgi:hypothetical protein
MWLKFLETVSIYLLKASSQTQPSITWRTFIALIVFLPPPSSLVAEEKVQLFMLMNKIHTHLSK